MDPNFVYPAIFKNQTGISYFPNSGALGLFASGGKFYLLTNDGYVSGLIDSSQTGNFGGGGGGTGYLTGYVSKSETGVFYPASNPSGFITGVDLSAYVTGDVVRPSETGQFVTVDVADSRYVNVTGSELISGEKRFYNETFFESGIRVSGTFTFNTGFSPQILDGEASWNNEYGTVQIGMNNGDVVNPIGFKNFYRVKANSNIAKGKVVMAVGAVGNSEFILAQEAANIGSSGELIMGVAAEAISAGNFGDIVSFGAVKGVDTSSFTSGSILYFDASSTGGFTNVPPTAPNAKVITAINVDASVNGTVFVRVSAGSVLGGTDSNVKFSTLQNNDFIAYNLASGLWYNKILTTGDISGIVNYVLKSETGSFISTSQTGQFVGENETGAFLTTGAADARYALQSATGSFVTTSQTGQFAAASLTGAFLTTGAADNRYALQSATGNFITANQTGAFVAASNTGSFLTTGAADGRYYGLSNGQSISGYAITGFNDAITGITVTGDTTKTITLFQRDNTTLTASFTDNAGSGSSDTGYLTGYVSKTETGNIAVGTIGLVLDGGGSTITTGYKSFTTAAFSGEILSYTVLADRTGSIVIDVWKDTYANYPLTSGDSICATNKVTLATGIKNTDSTLTSWIKTFSVGDNFGFNVDSVSGVQKISLTLRVKKA